MLDEAQELVQRELISVDEFKEFTFGNVAKLHTAQNPDYVKGTVVEQAVRSAVL